MQAAPPIDLPTGPPAEEPSIRTQVSMCAAEVADMTSFANLVGVADNTVANFFLSNDIATISDLITGRTSATYNAANAAATNPTGVNLTSLVIRGASELPNPLATKTIQTAKTIKSGSFGNRVVRTSVYARPKIGKSLFGKVGNGVIKVFSMVKLPWDTAGYLYGIWRCTGSI